jgi:hypothetical protein
MNIRCKFFEEQAKLIKEKYVYKYLIDKKGPTSIKKPFQIPGLNIFLH